MTTTIPTADTALAKARLIRDWYDSGAGRHAALADWVQSTTPDGLPMVSARLDGPLPVGALAAFAARQEVEVARRSGAGDVLPALDYSVPGRTGCVWRQDGVWVEVWHPNTPAPPVPRPGPPTAVTAPPRPVPAPPPRQPAVTPSGRLPRRPANRFRRTPKDPTP
ncbi:hypothetical protein ACTOXX_34185 [Streptomyces rubiginosohelvolus]|uniref:hypothetical protein n=1 Tax=Streptomyces rubiginosohelvolus TaxID=67362 RepID=UPI003F8DC117